MQRFQARTDGRVERTARAASRPPRSQEFNFAVATLEHSSGKTECDVPLSELIVITDVPLRPTSIVPVDEQSLKFEKDSHERRLTWVEKFNIPYGYAKMLLDRCGSLNGKFNEERIMQMEAAGNLTGAPLW